MNWTYDGGDPSMVLWTTAVSRFGLTLPDDAVVAELGCAETDWLERMRAQNPKMRVLGVDARRSEVWNRDHCLTGSAMDPTLFAEGSLDAVVMLGALEHFGLGFYGDPVDEDGDVKTMQNVARWLKPGGWVYADVPCNPEYAVTENRHFRIYSEQACLDRLIGQVKGRGILELGALYQMFCTTSDPLAGHGFDGWPIGSWHPYHYCAFMARK